MICALRKSFLKTREFKIRWVAVVVATGMVLSGFAQTAATLTDAGATAPVPGASDIAQLNTSGNTTFPDGLNYYTDNQTDHGAGEPGQTFTTPNSTNGFTMSSLTLKSAGLDSGGGSPAGSINYVLHIYSVSGGNVSPIASYISASPVSYSEGDWLKWTGLSVPLLPSTVYAWSFGKANSGGGWDAIGVAGGNLYPGGEIAMIPPAGGAMTLGSSHNYDASFDIGFLAGGPPAPPVVANLPATGIQSSAATLNGQIVSAGGDLPDVTIYYGTTDGGTNANNWQQAVSIGGQSGAFALTVPGLTAGTAYFYSAFAANHAGSAWATPSQSFTTPDSSPVPTPTAVLTYHNDNSRDGAYTNESMLTLANVNAGSFGRLFSYPVDGYVYAQPLVMTNVNIPGKGAHDVVYVVTEHDTVYAFDADGNQGADGGVLWSNHLGNSGLSASHDFGTRYHGGNYIDMVPEVGISGTPVIDPASGTIYFDAFTLDGVNNNVDVYHHRIHALDIGTGAERPYSPALVAASVAGHGVDSSNSVVTFTAVQQLQRSALTLSGGTLYVPYGSFADTDPYHGWVIGFNATNLQVTGEFNTTPNATVSDFGVNAAEGAIWMGGGGLCVDAGTNLFFETANGSFSANTNGGDYGDCFLKLSTTNGLGVADYFTPHDQASLQAGDVDLGSGGPVLLPDEAGSAAHPHLITGSGKSGKIYLVDRDNMGQYRASDDNQIVQSLPNAIGGNFGMPAYFHHLIFYQGNNDVMKAFSISNAVISGSPVSQSPVSFGFPGATPAISANGTGNAIAWAIQSDAYGSSGPAVLHAYNATNLSQQLYNSSQNIARDNPGPAVKTTVPAIAGGKVYVGTQGKLSVFGNGIFLTAPVIAPNGGNFQSSVTVNLVGVPTGVSVFYTLDGTAPTTNSILYAGPFTLTNGAPVRVIAFAPGAVASAVNSASFTVAPPIFFTSVNFSTNREFELGFTGPAGNSYILEATTNFLDWVPLITNVPSTNEFDLFDPNATNFPYRFYRVLQQ